MLKLLLVFISIFYLLDGCSTIKVKTGPEYVGIDPKAKLLYEEYVWLTKQHKITHKNKVTIGFKTINQGRIVGECTTAENFREIDIDSGYWDNSNNITRTTLLFHELTHCLCGRDHDYGPNKEDTYEEHDIGKVFKDVILKIRGNFYSGYLDDGCPKSIMYPSVLDNKCMIEHYEYYIKEMFDRCAPY